MLLNISQTFFSSSQWFLSLCKHFTILCLFLCFLFYATSFPWIPSFPSSSRPLLLNCKTSKYCFPETLLREEPLSVLFIHILAAVHDFFLCQEMRGDMVMRYGLLFGLVPHFVQHQWSSRVSFFFFFYGDDFDLILSVLDVLESKRLAIHFQL